MYLSTGGVRFGDHPLIHELYPDDSWNWHFITGRTQDNNEKAEVLLTNFEGTPA